MTNPGFPVLPSSPFDLSKLPQDIDAERLERLCRELLEVIGEDPDREGLKDTPARWARWWKEFAGYHAGNHDTVFESARSDQLVVVSGIRSWSLCEHHLLPFQVNMAIGYVAKDHILGLSKFARIVHRHSHKLQVQERLTAEVADEISSLVKTEDVAVVCHGFHLCMAMRGVRTNGYMTSSIMRGCFRASPSARAEFLTMAEQGREGPGAK